MVEVNKQTPIQSKSIDASLLLTAWKSTLNKNGKEAEPVNAKERRKVKKHNKNRAKKLKKRLAGAPQEQIANKQPEEEKTPINKLRQRCQIKSQNEELQGWFKKESY